MLLRSKAWAISIELRSRERSARAIFVLLGLKWPPWYVRYLASWKQSGKLRSGCNSWYTMPLNDEEREELIQQVAESLRPGLSIKLELDIQTKVCNQHFMNNACGSRRSSCRVRSLPKVAGGVVLIYFIESSGCLSHDHVMCSTVRHLMRCGGLRRRNHWRKHGWLLFFFLLSFGRITSDSSAFRV